GKQMENPFSPRNCCHA
ncbi:hypothetical protein C370_03645, partial [Cryptococcus neoformans A1-35-8]